MAIDGQAKLLISTASMMILNRKLAYQKPRFRMRFGSQHPGSERNNVL